ncbi:unnamed protein product, partial [Adineta steineri]
MKKFIYSKHIKIENTKDYVLEFINNSKITNTYSADLEHTWNKPKYPYPDQFLINEKFNLYEQTAHLRQFSISDDSHCPSNTNDEFNKTTAFKSLSSASSTCSSDFNSPTHLVPCQTYNHSPITPTGQVPYEQKISKIHSDLFHHSFNTTCT